MYLVSQHPNHRALALFAISSPTSFQFSESRPSTFRKVSQPVPNMHLLTLLSWAALAAASMSPRRLQKRCSLAHEPQYMYGYQPPAPCWLDFDSACQPQIRRCSEVKLDAVKKEATVTGVTEQCFKDIEEERARIKDGRPAYHWEEEHGTLANKGKGVLLITKMPAEAVKLYQRILRTQDTRGSDCEDEYWSLVGLGRRGRSM